MGQMHASNGKGIPLPARELVKEWVEKRSRNEKNTLAAVQSYRSKNDGWKTVRRSR